VLRLPLAAQGLAERTAPVIVIGASGPGLLTAVELARHGVPVRVFEQAERLDPQPRSLIVTPAIHRALGFAPTEATIHHVHSFDLHAAGASVQVALQHPDLIVERSALLRTLAARARAANVEIHFGWQFVGFDTEGSQTAVVLRRRGADCETRVVAQQVVGADGARSSVARVVGARAPKRVTNLQARVALPADYDPWVSRVWFAPTETPYFFWLVPESNTTAVVGLAIDDPGQARPRLERFLRAQALDPIVYEAARIPCYSPGIATRYRVGNAQVLLVGDAAAQVKVTTVGGTVTGFRGARSAALAIRANVDYRHETGALNRELLLHWVVRRILDRFSEDDYVALLKTLNTRVRAVLHAHTRDHMLRGMWPLLAGQPRLVALAARAAARLT